MKANSTDEKQKARSEHDELLFLLNAYDIWSHTPSEVDEEAAEDDEAEDDEAPARLKKKGRVRQSIAAAFLAFALLLIAPSAVEAGAIPEGTTITAANVEKHLDASFEGAPLRELLPDVLHWQIREKGLQLTLAHATPHAKDPKWVAATNANRGTVRLDAATKRVTGWQAGAPFPEVKLDDPQAGWKVAWNLFYGRPHGDSIGKAGGLLLIAWGDATLLV